jgi:hypothetical protein
MEVTPIIGRLTTVVVLAMTVLSVSALASPPPYPLLANAHGLRVYGPPSKPNTCPRLSALPPTASLKWPMIH